MVWKLVNNELIQGLPPNQVCHLQAVPSLHTSLHLPTAARALTGLAISQLGCTYAALYHIPTLSPSFSDTDTICTHLYAAVHGTHVMIATPLQRISRNLTANGGGVEVRAVFRSVCGKEVQHLRGNICVLSKEDLAYQMGLCQARGDVDGTEDPLSRCASAVGQCNVVDYAIAATSRSCG
jgi:hypothetical protein